MNFQKSGKKVPKYDSKPMDTEGLSIINSWAGMKQDEDFYQL